MTTLEKIEYFTSNAHTFPGCYPISALMHDGETMCHDCFLENIEAIKENSTPDIEPYDTEWELVDIYINYEDTDLYCCHCNNHLEAAYYDETNEEEELS